jgi:hypothetical protein
LNNASLRFAVYVPASVAALLASEFILIYLCYVAATFAFLRFDAEVFLVDDNGWLRILIVAICLILGIYFHDLVQQPSGSDPEILCNMPWWWLAPRSWPKRCSAT